MKDHRPPKRICFSAGAAFIAVRRPREPHTEDPGPGRHPGRCIRYAAAAWAGAILRDAAGRKVLRGGAFERGRLPFMGKEAFPLRMSSCPTQHDRARETGAVCLALDLDPEARPSWGPSLFCTISPPAGPPRSVRSSRAAGQGPETSTKKPQNASAFIVTCKNYLLLQNTALKSAGPRDMICTYLQEPYPALAKSKS